MLEHHGWLYVVIGLLLATLVLLAISHAARREARPSR
jgi:hypothetical protein